jgi:hypothetical protein
MPGLLAVGEQVEAALAQRTLTIDDVRLSTFGTELVVLGKSGSWFVGNVTIRYQRDSAAAVTSIRKFSGRRLFTFGGARLAKFTGDRDTEIKTFGGTSLTTFGGTKINRF